MTAFTTGSSSSPYTTTSTPIAYDSSTRIFTFAATQALVGTTTSFTVRASITGSTSAITEDLVMDVNWEGCLNARYRSFMSCWNN